jgi:hypothetical protein
VANIELEQGERALTALPPSQGCRLLSAVWTS